MSHDVRVIIRKFLNGEDLTEDEKMAIEDALERNIRTVNILIKGGGIIAAGVLTSIGISLID